MSRQWSICGLASLHRADWFMGASFCVSGLKCQRGPLMPFSCVLRRESDGIAKKGWKTEKLSPVLQTGAEVFALWVSVSMIPLSFQCFSDRKSFSIIKDDALFCHGRPQLRPSCFIPCCDIRCWSPYVFLHRPRAPGGNCVLPAHGRAAADSSETPWGGGARSGASGVCFAWVHMSMWVVFGCV